MVEKYLERPVAIGGGVHGGLAILNTPFPPRGVTDRQLISLARAHSLCMGIYFWIDDLQPNVWTIYNMLTKIAAHLRYFLLNCAVQPSLSSGIPGHLAVGQNLEVSS